VSTSFPNAASRPEEATHRFSLSRDRAGMWKLAGVSGACNFPDLAMALDCARRASDAEAATIEMWVDGLYICFHQPKGWPHRICAPGRAAWEAVSKLAKTPVVPPAYTNSSSSTLASLRSGVSKPSVNQP
jgi:hypothetical protein